MVLAGFAFVYMEDERDGQDAIRALDRCAIYSKFCNSGLTELLQHYCMLV
jgi:hypothetical protein